MNRDEKAQVISELKDKFSRAKAVVFADSTGMSVAETTEFRRLLKSSSLDYRVVKNTLARIASAETEVGVAADMFKGPVGVAIGYDDPVLVVKKVLEFTKTNEKLKVKGAVVEGKLCETKEIKEISELPSREMLLSMLAAAMQAPATKMAGTLAATINGFAYALEALKSQKSD